MKKRCGVVVLLLLGCLIAYLALPSNYYLRQALIHLWPRIDQQGIFHNRVVKAGDPRAWPVSDAYNTQAISNEFHSDFDRYQTVAFVVIKDSALLFEQYWNNYAPTSHSNSFSMAKSIVSLAIGCAIDDHFIESVDQPVSDFYPQFGGYNGKTLTLRHLLTMSAGVDFDESYSSLFSLTTQLYYGDDLRKITFDMKENEEPGVHFIYQSGVTQLLAFIVEKATGETLSAYVSRKLWTPMHAEEDALWSLDRPDGIEKAYCCFNSNARDFARFGQLLLNKGSFDNKQLISEHYLTQALTPDRSLLFKEYNEANRCYGFQFWHQTFHGLDVYAMRGLHGQYVFTLPQKNAVIVRLGHKQSDTRTPDQHYQDDMDIWLAAGLQIIGSTP